MRRALPPFPSFSPSESGVPVKRLLLVLPVAVLALSACESASSVPATLGDRVIASTTVAPAAPVEPVVDENPTGTVISSVAADEGISIAPGMASEYAAIICEGLDDDLSLLTMVQIAASSLPRFTEEQHAFLIGASVGASCPEFSYRIRGL